VFVDIVVHSYIALTNLNWFISSVYLFAPRKYIVNHPNVLWLNLQRDAEALQNDDLYVEIFLSQEQGRYNR